MTQIQALDGQTGNIGAVIDNKTSSPSHYWDDVHTQELKDNVDLFDFKTNADGPAAKYMKFRNRLIIPDEDGFFREFIIHEVFQINGVIEVYSKGSFNDLKRAQPINPSVYEGQTINTILDTILNGTRWQRGIAEYSGTRKIEFDDHVSPLEALQIVASTFELELHYRIETRGNKVIGRYVDAVQRVGEYRGREFSTGKDLINAKRSERDEIVTALIGLGPERDDGTRIEVTVTNEEARQAFGEDGNHLWDVHVVESDNQDMTVAEVEQYTQEALDKRISASIQWEVEAVDLEYIFGRSHEKIRLGDDARAKITEFNPPIYLTTRIVKITSPISDRTKKTYTLGEFVEYSEEDVKALKKELLKRIKDKANKTLIDANGEVVGGLDGDNNNFGRLGVGELDSPSVPRQSQDDVTLYVAETATGGDEPDDNADGLSWDKPLRTPTEALRRIAKQNDHTATIMLQDGATFYEYVAFEGMHGSGKIILNGGSRNTMMKNGVVNRGSTIDMEVLNMTVIPQSDYQSIGSNAGKMVVDGCDIRGKAGVGTLYGVATYDNGFIEVRNSSFYDVERCMLAQGKGQVHQINNEGNGSTYGLVARDGGRIFGSGTAPTGSVANVFTDDGEVSTNFTFDGGGQAPPAEVNTITETYEAQDADSFSIPDNVWDTTTNDVLQGAGYGAGPYKGAWFFGSNPTNDVTGKTIKQMRVKVTRATDSGGYRNTIRFRAHTHTSKPSGEPTMSNEYKDREFKRGESKWVTLPSSFYPLFESGNSKGIGIYSDTSEYARMTQSATLEITWEE